MTFKDASQMDAMRFEMSPEEERQYRKAIAALGMSPEERERDRAEKAKHNGQQRATFAQRFESPHQRAARERRENLEAHCDHHLRLAEVYEDRAREHRQKHEKAAALLETTAGAHG